MKILIVDDEEIQRRKLARLISESSISFSDILCAPDVPGAIEIIESQHPSIVLSDIRMPVKDGLELTQYIQESYPEILVILVTGYSEFEYAQAAIRYNVFDYILKPIDPESTLSCIRHATAKLESIKRRENNYKVLQTSVYKGYKQDKIEMRGDRAEMSDFPLYLNTVAGGLDRRDQTIGGFSFVVKIYAVPVVEIIG